MEIKNYNFLEVCQIELNDYRFKDERENIFNNNKYYNPSCRYRKNPLIYNRHANENSRFCVFKVNTNITSSGVYALFFGDTLVYIGRCVNFKNRWSSTGYCRISPKNVSRDGQSTNCHINSAIANQINNDSHTPVKLYFYSTPDYKSVEKELIKELNPLLNISLRND